MLFVAGIPINEDYSGIGSEVVEAIVNADFVIGEERKNILRVLAKAGARNKNFYILNEHTSQEEMFDILEEVKKANHVVLFSDAGTPCVADPGYKFIDLCYQFEIKVLSIPGPSSITAALSISGFYAERFYFAGFLPKDKRYYKDLWKKIDLLGDTTVIFERPYGIKNIIEFLKLIKHRRVVLLVNIGLENYRCIRGDVVYVINSLSNNPFLKSPFVLVIESSKQ
ncbi:MAG: hypothetical protein LDL13_05035 [Calditerrivibrio sp.]|nr:hypothetical protein [Calditerrivibrio sp.]